MNALTDRFLDVAEPQAEAPRLREIPYNYTSFSDREIVIRLLGRGDCGSCSTSCAASAAPAARRGCCSRCWATSGWSSAIPTCRTTCSTTRGAGSAGRRAAPPPERDREAQRRQRGSRIGARAAATDEAERSASVGRLVAAARAAVDRFAADFGETAALRRKARAHARAPHARGQHRLRRPRARVARDRRHRLARRVPVRRAVPGHRGRGARRWCRAASSSASPSSRAAAAPATPAARSRSTRARRSSTPKSWSGSRAVERIAIPGRADPVPTIDARRGRGHAAGDGSGRGRGAGVRRRSRPRPTRRASAATSR